MGGKLSVVTARDRFRAYIATGPMIALPAGALLAMFSGPRLFAARQLPPHERSAAFPSRPSPRLPDALDTWSFLEGFTLDGLFIIGLSFLGKDLLPGGAVVAAGVLLALRYGAEIVLSPVGGHMAERWGAERLLVSLSLLNCLALVGFDAGWLWGCAAAIVVLRALQLPLLAPIVAHRYPGPKRVQALAARAIWRDIGAGTGPLVAGFALPIIPAVDLYGVAALCLALAALACGRGRFAWFQP